MSNFQTQQQTPPRSSGGGFSALPQGAQQALTGIAGLAIVAAIVFGFAAFLGSPTGKQLFFESMKSMIIALAFLGLIAYAFMWVKVSISTNPTLYELAVPVCGLIAYYAALLVFSYVVAFAVSGMAAVINMTL